VKKNETLNIFGNNQNKYQKWILPWLNVLSSCCTQVSLSVMDAFLFLKLKLTAAN